MPPMKIQPLDFQAYRESAIRNNDSTKPVLKLRLKRLLDRQFPSVMRISSATEKPPAAGYEGTEFEPNSVCLAKMVQNFIEETNVKQSTAKCGRNRRNCFNGNNDSFSDDEFDVFSCFGDSIATASPGDSMDTLKSLIPCASVAERILLAETSKIVETNNTCKQKDGLRKIVIEGMLLLGYDASICKSRWGKSPSYPAGEYDYIDVIVEGERVLIDIDFRSEFEIARPTGGYRAILQSLPLIFVGSSNRLQQIVSTVSEAARQSLKKKEMPIPPWRKVEYMRAKWLSSHSRTSPPLPNAAVKATENTEPSRTEIECGELERLFGEKTVLPEEINSGVTGPWNPPAIESKRCERGGKVVTGLASLLR